MFFFAPKPIPALAFSLAGFLVRESSILLLLLQSTITTATTTTITTSSSQFKPESTSHSSRYWDSRRSSTHMSYYVPPGQQRTLRACMVCSLVQLHSVSLLDCLLYHPYASIETDLLSSSGQKFMREGCPNCDTVLGLRGNNDAVQECTSQVFEGLITLSDPNTSWVARWQRLDSYVPGTYAVKVTGSVS